MESLGPKSWMEGKRKSENEEMARVRLLKSWGCEMGEIVSYGTAIFENRFPRIHSQIVFPVLSWNTLVYVELSCRSPLLYARNRLTRSLFLHNVSYCILQEKLERAQPRCPSPDVYVPSTRWSVAQGHLGDIASRLPGSMVFLIHDMI